MGWSPWNLHRLFICCFMIVVSCVPPKIYGRYVAADRSNGYQIPDQQYYNQATEPTIEYDDSGSDYLLNVHGGFLCHEAGGTHHIDQVKDSIIVNLNSGGCKTMDKILSGEGSHDDFLFLANQIMGSFLG